MGASAAAAVVGTAVTAYTVNKTHEAQNTQRRAQLTALKQANRLLKTVDPAKSNAAAAAAQQLQRQQAANAYGYRDTILTSPLGIVGDNQPARRTLLGS